jgi:hypothetical protein
MGHRPGKKPMPAARLAAIEVLLIGVGLCAFVPFRRALPRACVVVQPPTAVPAAQTASPDPAQEPETTAAPSAHGAQTTGGVPIAGHATGGVKDTKEPTGGAKSLLSEPPVEPAPAFQEEAEPGGGFTGVGAIANAGMPVAFGGRS